MTGTALGADQLALIGRMVCAYGELEYVLGGLFIDIHVLRHGERVDDRDAPEAMSLERAMGQSLGQYPRLLGDLLPDIEIEAARTSIQNIASLVQQHAKFRNTISHGVWRREGEAFRVSFWSYKAITRLRVDSEIAPKELHFMPWTAAHWIDQIETLVREIEACRALIRQDTPFRQ
ncbi:hypothetical protein Q4511_05020 [Paracoccus sp. 1_MG-2023]|uniref:hypothetical protein n=1 Tax=unclassified Paracoccus (in: a-proteobacteria) TaxID=2688777 RepID=UPI001C099C31|nr:MULTISPECIES: hypothetical protein [unclassified Paracoccus (in: a-proteobacteria)]MBU2958151.1 hypothetical protein [Paracoccus sp. C2R09]MDO6668278.1 hypothetical protein [Paracoccus sp. 1_MG-2023]